MEKAVITSVEELKILETSDKIKITELVVAGFTDTLNNDDVKVSQAAGLIKEIIRNQKNLQRIFLQNNNFPPPELQFIIKAIIDKKNDNNANPLLEINLTNAVSNENLERSNRELRHLKKVYGDNIAFDDAVYAYFINRYEAACEDYLKFLAKEIIIPKKDKSANVEEQELLATADRFIQELKNNKAKPDSKLDDAVLKYQLVRELNSILHATTAPLATLETFQNHYEKTRKKMPSTRTKIEDEKTQKFHAQVGDSKAESFNFPKKHPNSIFKLAASARKKPTRKKKKKRTLSK